MSRILYLLVTTACWLSLPCQAQLITVNVPFQNVFMNPNDQLQASFSFGPQQLLFCFATNTQIVGVITWPFRGYTQTSSLPVFLKTNAIFSGFFSDPVGTINITNTSGQLLQVGCLFGY